MRYKSIPFSPWLLKSPGLGPLCMMHKSGRKRKEVFVVYLNPQEPTFLSGPYKFHIRVYNKNRQTSRVW